MRVEWRFEKITRHTYTHSIAFSALKFVRYWNVILPGSKRYLGGSRIVGANGDVRPPAPDEVREGGIAVEGIALTASGRDEAGHAGPGRRVQCERRFRDGSVAESGVPADRLGR